MIRKLCGPVHVAVLAFWLCAVVCAGATAAVVFPTMKQIDPTLSTYPSYTGPHWMLTAGHVGAKVFKGLDYAAIACLPLALATGAAAWFPRDRAKMVIARWAVLALLCVLTAYQLGVLHPAMYRDLHAFWDAAKAGDNALAETHREAFHAMHPRSTQLLSADALVLALALVLAIVSTARSMTPRAEAA